ncbi:PH domain-containing protein [Haladaptatus litoreus]|uniref:PH domain-containing protein n=1 Tax=Haladaptatus litoreus TaxID=553468 RepID=A0A1N7E4K0_9EURY|nr:PH domain-containing protein [Haladaptatus litoreus]SIR83000.1 PH domain-containing protein [Haladaptatus litoreus]
MTGTDWLVLDDGEEIQWQGHPRLMSVLPALVVGLILIGGSLVVAATSEPLVLLLVPLGIVIPAFSYLSVSNTRFVVTDRALYRKTGVLSRNVRRLSIDRVQNSNFRQGIRGTMFDYGTVSIEVAGGGGVQFQNIETPRDVRATIDRQTTTDSIPGTLAQWNDVLEAVRALRFAVEDRIERNHR